jgi:uncharacterized protein with LGFP repeats
MKNNARLFIIILISFGALKGMAQAPRPQLSVEKTIRSHAALPYINMYTGDVVGDKASPSSGNKNDGTGYFMLGAKQHSFFYYVSRTSRVYANWGVVRDKFTQAGYEFGMLGWPRDDEKLLPDGSGFFQAFDHGYIYWCPRYGACVVKGLIFEHWARNNWERGVFGYPAADEVNYPNSSADYTNRAKKEVYISYQKFQNGTIYYVFDKISKQYKTLSEITDPNWIPSRPH